MNNFGNSIAVTIAERIADRLNRKNWTPYRLWKEIGGSRPGVYKICNGNGAPSVERLRDIAAALDCTMDDLAQDN